MSSPRTSRTGASRARRIVAVSVAALVLACLSGVASSGSASADDQLKQSKQELHATKDKVRAQLRKIRKLQRRMNGLATRISKSQSDIVAAEERIDKLEREMTILRVRASLLQSKLDERNREAYMFGGAPVLYLLTATSAAEAASRMSFLTEMNRRDAVLATKVHEASDRLARSEGEVVRARQVIELTKRRLELDQQELRKTMAQSKRLVAGLRDRVEQIQYEISRIRPFSVCPLAGPHAIADDFGIMVHHPPNQGGDHIHQGNDIYAAMGVADRRAVRRRGRHGDEPHRRPRGQGVRRLRLRLQRAPVAVRTARDGAGGRRDRLRRRDRQRGRSARPLRVASRATARRSTRTGSC